jgi:hypothetical protein
MKLIGQFNHGNDFVSFCSGTPSYSHSYKLRLYARKIICVSTEGVRLKPSYSRSDKLRLYARTIICVSTVGVRLKINARSGRRLT